MSFRGQGKKLKNFLVIFKNKQKKNLENKKHAGNR